MNNDDINKSTEEQRVKQLWSSVPYHDVERIVAPAAADLINFVGVSSGDQVLDVACGSGNTAITASRREATVTGIDLNEDMLGWAKENAALIDVDVTFRKEDVTNLSVPDDTYDVTVSTFGHHLTSDPVTATHELVRVTRPNGRVGFTAYALDGLIGGLYKTLATYHPEGDMVVEPLHWGDKAFIQENFKDRFASMDFKEGSVKVHGLSPTHIMDHILDISGVVRTLLEQANDQDALFDEWVEVTSDYFEDNSCSIDYLMVRGSPTVD